MIHDDTCARRALACPLWRVGAGASDRSVAERRRACRVQTLGAQRHELPIARVYPTPAASGLCALSLRRCLQALPQAPTCQPRTCHLRPLKCLPGRCIAPSAPAECLLTWRVRTGSHGVKCAHDELRSVFVFVLSCQCVCVCVCVCVLCGKCVCAHDQFARGCPIFERLPACAERAVEGRSRRQTRGQTPCGAVWNRAACPPARRLQRRCVTCGRDARRQAWRGRCRTGSVGADVGQGVRLTCLAGLVLGLWCALVLGLWCATCARSPGSVGLYVAEKPRGQTSPAASRAPPSGDSAASAAAEASGSSTTVAAARGAETKVVAPEHAASHHPIVDNLAGSTAESVASESVASEPAAELSAAHSDDTLRAQPRASSQAPEL